MRQVFTSARLENVEGVAQLLRDHGIEVRITNGRSYKGAIRGNFNYSEAAPPGRQPAVWIVKSEDQPQARVLLREAGLLETTRMPTDSYLTPTMHADATAKETATAQRRAFRIKLGLLVVIAAVISLYFFALRKPSPAPAASPAVAAAIAQASPASEPTFVIATPPALATMLFAAELEAQTPALACLAIDGKDASDALIAELRRTGTSLLPASACMAGNAQQSNARPLKIDVKQYRTDGSGVGTVLLEMSDTGKDGQLRHESRALEVEREGDRWRVRRVL